MTSAYASGTGAPDSWTSRKFFVYSDVVNILLTSRDSATLEVQVGIIHPSAANRRS